MTSEEIKNELADKLEILLSMAAFKGYTLQDIIIDADKKRIKNGGFKERILLSKIVSDK